MARYIDADEYRKRLDMICGDGYAKQVIDVFIDWFMSIAESIEPEDVAPVIHANWQGVNPLVDTIECSHCGYEWFTCEIATPYCPECGATMDNYKEIGEIGLPDVEVL